MSVVVYLEMTDASQLCSVACKDPFFQVEEAKIKQWPLNRFLYSWVGADWSWYDKLSWSDEQWQSYAEDDRLRTFLAYYYGTPCGYFELLECEGEVEIAILGLTPNFIGRGFGSVLLSKALKKSWEMKPKRVWLHTCSLDHPSALGNYKARGMKVYKTENG